MAVRYEFSLAPQIHKVHEVEQEEAASILMMLQYNTAFPLRTSFTENNNSTNFFPNKAFMNFEPTTTAAQNSHYPICMNCGTRNSPAWRNGGTMDNGKKRLLCNACGLRWRREKQ